MPYVADRLHGVVRAGRLVLAAPRQRRRDQPLVDADRSERQDLRSRLAARDADRAAFASSSAERAAHALEALALAELARVGRATTTTSWPAGSAVAPASERLAQQALDPVALDGAADLAADREPEPRRPRLLGVPARER